VGLPSSSARISRVPSVDPSSTITTSAVHGEARTLSTTFRTVFCSL
jgi:hypothetical protein